MSFLKNQEQNPEFLNDYLKYTRYILQSSENTVNELYFDIRTFFRYLIVHNDKANKIDLDKFKEISIADITLDDLDNVNTFTIQDFISFLRNFSGNAPKTRNRKLASLKNFFSYRSSINLITSDPTANVKFANVEKRQPKYLNLNQSKDLLSKTIQSSSRNTIRNYAIISLFLNCCLRLGELIGINLTDVKLDDKTLKVKGKGNKERIVYLDDSVSEALEEYLKVRPTLPITDPNYNALFLSERKKRISRRNVQLIIDQELVKIFEEKRKGYHTHSLRHTGATLMYNENDTNILIIQKILGHKLLSSTEIYTHVSDKKLKYIMENCTISSILERKGDLENGKE